jgi:hypothetical protein
LKLIILSEEKFGIRKGLSADKVVNIFMDDIPCALDNKAYIGGLFCDLAKTCLCES